MRARGSLRMGIVNFLQKLSKVLPETVRPYGGTLLKWAIIGYLIRIFIMPLFVSGDLLTLAWSALTFSKEQQLVPAGDPCPITFFLSAFYAMTRPIVPSNVVAFITSNVGYTPTPLKESMVGIMFVLHQAGMPTFILISKIPYLIFDFATALLLLHFTEDGKKATSIFKFWMINPFSIFICYYAGQYDIIPAFFMMYALYFLKKQKGELTMLLLGVASAFKVFSMLFVLPVVILLIEGENGLTNKAKYATKLLGITLLPLIVTFSASFLTPVYYESANLAMLPRNSFIVNGFFGRTLYNRGSLGQPFLLGLFLYTLDYSVNLPTLAGFPDVIYVFPLIYALFILWITYFKWSFEKFWKAILAFLLAYYSIALFHLQWFLWAQPFLVLLVVENPKKFLKLYLTLIPLYFIYISYWSPTIPFILNNIGLPGFQVINLFRSIFSAICIFMAFLIIIPDRILNMIKNQYL